MSRSTFIRCIQSLLGGVLLLCAAASFAQAVFRVTAIPDESPTELARKAAPLMKYAERLFSRPAFIEALTPSEKVMRR